LRKLWFVACLLATPGISHAQKDTGSWESLNALRSGEKIEVVETSLMNHKGTLVTVSEESIALRESGVEQAIKKENVIRVTQLEKSHRLRNALIFGVVGGGAGAIIGVAAGGACRGSYFVNCSAGKRAAFGGVAGLVVGLPIGALVSSHDTIYRVKTK